MKFVKEEQIKVKDNKTRTCYSCINRDGSLFGATNPNAESDYEVSWGFMGGNHFFTCKKHLIPSLKEHARQMNMKLVVEERGLYENNDN